MRAMINLQLRLRGASPATVRVVHRRIRHRLAPVSDGSPNIPDENPDMEFGSQAAKRSGVYHPRCRSERTFGVGVCHIAVWRLLATPVGVCNKVIKQLQNLPFHQSKSSSSVNVHCPAPSGVSSDTRRFYSLQENGSDPSLEDFTPITAIPFESRNSALGRVSRLN